MTITTENYYIETPKAKRVRRHEEDKLANPDRHNPQKNNYSYEESLNLCFWCAPFFTDKYQYDAKTHRYIRIEDKS